MVQRAAGRPTSFTDVCTSDAGLVKVLGMDGSQGVEQGMPGGVVPPVTHVNAPHKGDQAALESLIPHVGIGGRLGTCGWAVVTWAAAPQLLQLVFGPGTRAVSSPRTACKTSLWLDTGEKGGV